MPVTTGGVWGVRQLGDLPVGGQDRTSRAWTWAVQDLKRSLDFYRNGLGWEPQVEVPVYVEFGLPDGRRFGLYQRESFAINTGMESAGPVPDTTATEIYLRCDDLDAAIARLEAAGATCLAERAAKPWGDEAAYFADPDQNVIVLARPLPANSA